MSNSDSHIWPGTPQRRSSLAERLLARILLLCGLGLGPAALAGMQDCEWALTGEAGDRPGQTRQQTKRELREELARKLKQFDDCMARTGDGLGGDGLGKDGAEGSAGDSGERMASAANPTQAGAPASVEGSGEDADGEGREVAAQPAAPPKDPAGPFDPASPPPAADPPDAADPPPEVVSAGRPQGAGENPQPALVEDDLARLIREAAEKETDPARRAALWEQYNSYVKTL